MKNVNEQRLDSLLSQYIDGSLSENEVHEVETFLAMDTSAREKLEELRRLKELLGTKQKLTPDIGFWTRFSVALENQKQDEHNLLPFPRKYLPMMVTTFVVMVVVVGTLILQNRMQFVQYFSKKSLAVKEVYEKNVLQGQLLPLFSKVDKDRALQFSLFGTLALDDKSKTELRVDEQSAKGYRIEVGKDSKNKTKPVTFDHFLAEVKPTREQKHLIDSLLELTGRRIESSVLLGENNAMAIAPDLPRLNRMMVTNIASCLEPMQRVQFERLLEANDAPYKVTSQSTEMNKGDRVFQNIPEFPRGDRFVLITPDTMVYTQIHIDLDSLRRQMQENMIAVELRREAMLKRIIAREFHHAPKDGAWPLPVHSFGNEEFFSVEINVPAEESDQQQMHVIIRPRVRKQALETETQGQSIQIRVGTDTAFESTAP
jgi:hypothetical protein